jgi:hypothetical protein
VDSQWREAKFVLSEIQSAVNLKMGLAFMLANWEDIKDGLREPPRLRLRQHQALEKAIKGYGNLY